MDLKRRSIVEDIYNNFYVVNKVIEDNLKGLSFIDTEGNDIYISVEEIENIDNVNCDVKIGSVIETSDGNKISVSSIVYNHGFEYMVINEHGIECYIEEDEIVSITNTTPNNKNKMTMNNSNNNSVMTNNAMNMKNIFQNIEFGQVKGDDFKLSLDGIAVKSDEGNYLSYKDGELTDNSAMVFDCGQFFAMPVSKLNVGDLIKTGNKIGYVTKTTPNIVMSDIKSNEIKTIMPSKNIFGLSFYTKIVSMMDMFGDNDNGLDPMLMMFMMNGQGENKGNDQMMQTVMLMNMMGAKSEMNELLPLLMMGGMNGNDNSNPMANMMPLMLMQGEEGKMDMKDMMFMSMMSQQTPQTNGNNTNQMNPMLMMFMMKGKKEGSKMNKMLPMLMMSQGNSNGSDGMAQMMMMQFLNKVEKSTNSKETIKIDVETKDNKVMLNETDYAFIKSLQKKEADKDIDTNTSEE